MITDDRDAERFTRTVGRLIGQRKYRRKAGGFKGKMSPAGSKAQMTQDGWGNAGKKRTPIHLRGPGFVLMLAVTYFPADAVSSALKA